MNEGDQAEALTRIIGMIERAARTTGPEADFARSDIDRIAESLTRDGIDTPLLTLSATALAQDHVDPTSSTRSSRCWCQWFNRVTAELPDDVYTDPARLTSLLESLGAELQPVEADDQDFARDIRASVAAAAAWQLMRHTGANTVPILADADLRELLLLYLHRYHFAAPSILNHLAGHPDLATNAVKAGFAFFAHIMLGNTKEAAQVVKAMPTEEGRIPLAASKLVAYTLASAPIDSGISRGGTLEAELLDVFRRALGVWEAHGADGNYYRSKASYAALIGDSASLNESINAAIGLLSTSDGAQPGDFQQLMRLRVELFDRVAVHRELAGAQEIRKSADQALEVARSTANQVPTVVGLFTAVIALVIGSSQLAQGVSPQDRILIVASLGTILLMFVVALAGITRYMTDTGVSTARAALFIGGAVASCGLLITVLYRVASSS